VQVPGDLLDLILVVLAAAFAVAGYRQGFIVGVLSFAGFVGGAAVGAVISPAVARFLARSPGQQGLIAILVVFLAAAAGQLAASAAGAFLRARITWRPAALLDALGGAAVSVLSVLLIAWFIGSAVANAPFPAVVRQVNDSAVLRAVDRFMPAAAHQMFSDFRQLFAAGPYTQVFGALGAEGALLVGPPNPAVLRSAGLARDRDSIVKIIGTAPECGRSLQGSGFVISRDHIITNAHVVAAVTVGPFVRVPGHGSYRARVVLFDPQRDVAVLYVPRLPAAPLRFRGPARRGANAIVAGYPLDHGFTAVPARVGSISLAHTQNIYLQGSVTRSIYSIRARVRPGNSGGPLLAPDGAVYGVVFAASVSENDVGYALTAGEVAPDVHRGESRTTAVSTRPSQCS
jgi:S1-C subfamily serine protease